MRETAVGNRERGKGIEGLQVEDVHHVVRLGFVE
jgi:hypothetical protein